MNNISSKEAEEILYQYGKYTYVDNNSFSYFMLRNEFRNAMFIVTGLNSYQEIMEKYEGKTLNEVIERDFYNRIHSNLKLK